MKRSSGSVYLLWVSESEVLPGNRGPNFGQGLRSGGVLVQSVCWSPKSERGWNPTVRMGLCYSEMDTCVRDPDESRTIDRRRGERSDRGRRNMTSSRYQVRVRSSGVKIPSGVPLFNTLSGIPVSWVRWGGSGSEIRSWTDGSEVFPGLSRYQVRIRVPGSVVQ